jgi:hypothetical protein
VDDRVGSLPYEQNKGHPLLEGGFANPVDKVLIYAIGNGGRVLIEQVPPPHLYT